ncbi:MAG: hypothetical protein Q4P34_02925 [Tissierellia bacterium]|nr:hypothetical protein [Tissierellia bacterium]
MLEFEIKSISRFLKIRNQLIIDLENGKLDKKDFLIENYLLIEKLNMKPFLINDTIGRCVYNYQYYNVLAKYYKMCNLNLKSSKKSRKIHDINKSKIANYYIEKDKIILDLIKLVNKEDLVAYPLLLNSEKLDNKLFEIILLNYEKVILHSINQKVKDSLIDKGVFDPNPRKSKIDHYVNIVY